MAYKFRTYECYGTKKGAEPHRFEVFLSTGEHPRFCPVCGAQFEDKPEAVPGTHSIGGSAITKAVDGMYRNAEIESAERAEFAGNPQLKITNMRDHLREGDIAAPSVNNFVTGFMDQASNSGIHYGFGAGYAQQMAAMAQASGNVERPLPQNPEFGGLTGAGHVALDGVQGTGGRTHATRRAMMTAAGNQGKG